MIRVDRCEHEPMLYGETKNSQYGERTLFFVNAESVILVRLVVSIQLKP